MATDAAAAFLLEKVSGIIVSYADLISGASKEFKKLQEDVKLLKANLDVMSDLASTDQRIKVLQEQVRDVIYEVEDTIDSWLTQAATLKGKNAFKRVTKWLNPNQISLASQVKSLRLNEVKKMLDETRTLGPVLGTRKEEQARGMEAGDPSVKLENVVPFKNGESYIYGCLTTPQKELDIIPVIGMPGMGKTTMAWKIFNDEWTCNEFPIRIWVHFSQRFSSQDVFHRVINQINKTDNNLSSKTDRELSILVHACLKGKTFLMVFDDVWETKHWDVISNALPYSNGNGKVLITSRHKNVGTRAKHLREPYEHRPLDTAVSWKLLQFGVFGNLESCPKELEEIGKRIAEDCKGVPLIIKLMGGVLKNHFSTLKSPVMVKKKWEEMSINVTQALKGHDQDILDIVEMSYDSLPDHLRDCFLYLGVFPEGYKIPSWTLTCLWIAEGFIKPGDDKSLEEIAKDNLDELISRNLLMTHKINSMLEVKVCGVHDMIRVFCRSKASEENLFKEINMVNENQVANDALVSQMESIRRLCLHSNLSTFFSSNLKGPRVRSFLSFRKEDMHLEAIHNSSISEKFLSLRILQSKSIKFNQFPESVTKLTHLRYIVLCVDDLTTLPEPISQLWNLQTIIVDTNSNSIDMKANIWKMIRLRHIKTKAAIVLDKKWEGAAGENLQILNRLSPESVTAAFSQKASKLKTLGIRGKLASLFDNMSLEKLNDLEKLKLYHAATENRLQSFPDRNRFPPNLKRLTLSNTSLDWNHMYTLAMLGDLEVLKLKNNAFSGTNWKAVNYVFNNLQFLLIATTDLLIWEASANAFPLLRHLVLKDCEGLNQIPEHILKKLENLEIEKVRKSLADSLKNSSLQFKLSVGA